MPEDPKCRSLNLARFAKSDWVKRHVFKPRCVTSGTGIPALRAPSSMRWYSDCPFCIRPHFHVYIDALIQTAQDRHQAVNREPPDVRVPNPGEIGGGNARQFRSLSDPQAPAG